MATPVLPPALKEKRSDERETFALINAIRRQTVISGRRTLRQISGASGDITLVGANANAIEFFDDDGNSLGVVQMLDFTVNP